MADTLTAQQLRDVLDYEPDSGRFLWRKFRGGSASAGSQAGTPDKRGYIRITLLGRKLAAHRLAWLYMTGEWPAAAVDHINMVPSDNRWANLRAATFSQNLYNRRCLANNVSGVKGVRFREQIRKWEARISKDGVTYHLGSFEALEAARAAYAAAAANLHGEFARAA